MPVPQGSGVINRKSARQAVYEEVCDWIITGVLEPGEKILDSELGEYFHVSRTPVREALQQLQSQKLVLVMPGRATVVAPLDPMDIEQCYKPLAELQALAAELACGKLTQEELLANLGDGLYLTEVSGLHAGANPISGDFSLLSRGFEIKGGKIVRAVEEFTVAGNFYQLLKDITGVGSNLYFEASPIGSPPVLVKSLSVAGE